MKRLAIVVALSLMLVACAGTPFKWDDARRIKEGMTTSEVAGLIGRPYSVRASGDLVTYIWVEVSMLDYSTKTLRVDFRDGRAVKAPPIPEEFH